MLALGSGMDIWISKHVSDLLRGRIDLFSTDALIDMLARLGVRVNVVLKPTRGGLKVA